MWLIYKTKVWSHLWHPVREDIRIFPTRVLSRGILHQPESVTILSNNRILSQVGPNLETLHQYTSHCAVRNNNYFFQRTNDGRSASTTILSWGEVRQPSRDIRKTPKSNVLYEMASSSAGNESGSHMSIWSCILLHLWKGMYRVKLNINPHYPSL